jgi:hypothetical protein
MNDLADEQRTMHMAEQYSDRRIMVNSSSNEIHFIFFFLQRSAMAILRQYVIKRRMKQRLNWIAIQHRARTV